MQGHTCALLTSLGLYALALHNDDDTMNKRGDDTCRVPTCASLKSPETLRPLLASLGSLRAALLWAPPPPGCAGASCSVVTCPNRTLLEGPLPGSLSRLPLSACKGVNEP